MSLEIQQKIAEAMQAYKAGYSAFESSKVIPSGYKQHESDCFRMGLKAAQEGKPYPKSQIQIGEALTDDLSAVIYSQGCSE